MDFTPYLGWIVFLHVLSVFLFAAGHGVSLVAVYRIRYALGQPVARAAKGTPPPVTLPMDQVAPMLVALRPEVLAAIGGGGFVVILYLMMFKPF
jgi:hypothetical protein